jgi:CxxC motif-containing protein (DUF1111 family)
MTPIHTLPLFSGLALAVLLAASDADAARPFRHGDNSARAARFLARGSAPAEDVATTDPGPAAEAPAGFDNLSNGFEPQGPDYGTLHQDNVVAGRSFNDDRFIFEEVETIADGLGPTYNAQSCGECHQNVVTGGSSQIAEHRTGHLNGDVFFEAPGGSLIQSRATEASIVEHVDYQDDISTFRLSSSTLGDGFVECIANETLLGIRDQQPRAIRGTAVIVSVLEAAGAARVGRFGWKSQHASLESFAADAYVNEMGVTSPLMPDENTSSGRFVGYGSDYDPVPDPEDDGEDIHAFAGFMRSTKAPPRGEITADVLAGEQLFQSVGCSGCHIPSIRTARAGTAVNGGALLVPQSLGNKLIHPYSDFLLHDIGSGDGIPVLPTPGYEFTARQIRTAPLWGLRTRNRLMHDGLTFTTRDAIVRHGGQAAGARAAFNRLGPSEQTQLRAFLDSL